MLKKLWLTQQNSLLYLPKKLIHLVLIGGVIAIFVSMTGILLRGSKGALVSEQVPARRVVVPQNVRFTIYAEGIFPARATVGKGLISILIEDLAGTDQGIRVERINQHGPVAVANVRRFNQHLRGRASIELSPGWSNYTYNADGQRTRRKINNQCGRHE